MLQNQRPPVRLFPKLATQLVPAVVVTVVGVLTLGNLTKAPDAVSAVASVPTPITTEAVFTATPRPVDDEQPARAAAVARPAAKPKVVAANVSTLPRKPAEELRQVEPRQAASVSAPLAIVQIPAPPQAPAPETSVLGRVWGATTAVAVMPYRAAQSVTGWFVAATPPRPPEPVPLQQFQAAL